QGFDLAALAASARKSARARELLQGGNARCVAAVRHRHFRENMKRSVLSSSELDSAGKAFKKAYATGRRELEHEFGKTMRYRSIRDLAAEATGAVVNDLKPVWLMSPLSVSDTLPLANDLFDVVIFDEASQIPMEEAVPALSRAAQVIVVGDEMQLPPTSFFSSAPADGDVLLESEDEDGDPVAILLDADSLLNQAARTLPATMLAWHYRSRSEALINFSNAAFYDGRLVTVPDRALPQKAEAPAGLRSNDGDAPKAAVDHLLARAISFHAVSDGVYESRANAAEAKLIARMVREIFQRGTRLSIGIVAFSEAQQTEIERALDALAEEDTAFGVRLEEEYAREDEGQVNELFVKNLENVQGDERDIILMSVCYAPDKSGRMAMNFGPINQRGGEKRLNVIFSRARHHMAVVSTIRASAITNTHNDGARALSAFLAFAEAQARGDVSAGQAVLATLNPDARRVFASAPPRDALRDAIAEALRERGHDVREYVGSSSFRADLTVAHADRAQHGLAILIDGAATTGVYDRYVFQPKIMRTFGWRVIDVPAHAWLRDPSGVLDEIEQALFAGDGPVDDDPFDQIVAEPRRRARKQAEEAKAPPPSEPQQFIELRFEEGASKKFWKAAVSGVELTIIYGRIGAKGATLVKSFPTAERAQREAEKLIAEKLAKGYQRL
ncbi:MAG TPA: AAA domain-containing protein, partial [Terricaulis sp.]|nr:AAA domain-containing protein [Terricaulis sp.]